MKMFLRFLRLVALVVALAAPLLVSPGAFASIAPPYNTYALSEKFNTPIEQNMTGFGSSVAMSADGLTAAVGVTDLDGSGAGSIGAFKGGVVVFVRDSITGEWSQQGDVLSGTPALGDTYQGTKIALSADGNMLFVASQFDDSANGAVWFFMRTSGIWSQESKIVSALDAGSFGLDLALSRDASTLVVTTGTNSALAIAFSPTGNTWEQEGPFINTTFFTVDPLSPDAPTAIALSADASILVLGRAFQSLQGNVYVFERQPSKEYTLLQVMTSNPIVGTSIGLSPDGGHIVAGGASPVYYSVDSNGMYQERQVISPPSGSTSDFGQSGLFLLPTIPYRLFIGDVSMNIDNGVTYGGMFVYELDGTTWTKARGNLSLLALGYTTQSSDVSAGATLAFSQDGKDVILGATAEDSFSGSVFLLRSNIGLFTFSPTAATTPSPSSDSTTMRPGVVAMGIAILSILANQLRL